MEREENLRVVKTRSDVKTQAIFSHTRDIFWVMSIENWMWKLNVCFMYMFCFCIYFWRTLYVKVCDVVNDCSWFSVMRTFTAGYFFDPCFCYFCCAIKVMETIRIMGGIVLNLFWFLGQATYWFHWNAVDCTMWSSPDFGAPPLLVELYVWSSYWSQARRNHTCRSASHWMSFFGSASTVLF